MQDLRAAKSQALLEILIRLLPAGDVKAAENRTRSGVKYRSEEVRKDSFHRTGYALLLLLFPRLRSLLARQVSALC